MKTPPGRHFLTPEHPTELGWPEPLPLDEQEHLPVRLTEHGQGLMDRAALCRHRKNLLEGSLSSDPVGESISAPPGTSGVGGDATCRRVQPCPRSLARWDQVDLAPCDYEDLGDRIFSIRHRPGSPTAVGGDVELVGLEQRVESLPTAGVITHQSVKCPASAVLFEGRITAPTATSFPLDRIDLMGVREALQRDNSGLTRSDAIE